MTKTISKDIPLSELTLRKYEKPNEEGRSLVRKLCLSLGLLQPGDSRDIIVDVLYVILWAKKAIQPEEIEKFVKEERKRNNQKLTGVSSSNIRRQLKRLKDISLIEKAKSGYRKTENLSLTEIFEDKIEKYLLNSIKERVKEYIKKVDEEF
jgi:DNA-binding transcriptional ArsR family regulator